ncbi:uncharacterized protein CMC5_040460 [Chondromyces crocatus]|uniref:Uncharacterized protein n=1 Tax=Chondromyces crocatus TaxID=52 RepID=A0A0K1EG95_CHOCO|nr:uncharacterized protein CMC5_040460 [Chondromyces crocatus]
MLAATALRLVATALLLVATALRLVATALLLVLPRVPPPARERGQHLPARQLDRPVLRPTMVRVPAE